MGCLPGVYTGAGGFCDEGGEVDIVTSVTSVVFFAFFGKLS